MTLSKNILIGLTIFFSTTVVLGQTPEESYYQATCRIKQFDDLAWRVDTGRAGEKLEREKWVLHYDGKEYKEDAAGIGIEPGKYAKLRFIDKHKAPFVETRDRIVQSHPDLIDAFINSKWEHVSVFQYKSFVWKYKDLVLKVDVLPEESVVYNDLSSDYDDATIAKIAMEVLIKKLYECSEGGLYLTRESQHGPEVFVFNVFNHGKNHPIEAAAWIAAPILTGQVKIAEKIIKSKQVTKPFTEVIGEVAKLFGEKKKEEPKVRCGSGQGSTGQL